MKKKKALSTTREKEKLLTINKCITTTVGATPRLGHRASATVSADEVMKPLQKPLEKFRLSHSHRIQWSSVEMRLNVMHDFYNEARELQHGLSGLPIARLLLLLRYWLSLLLAACPHR